MKRVLFRIFLLCTILTLFVACGSDAQPEEPATQEVEVTTPQPAPAPAPVEPEPSVVVPKTDWAAINAGKKDAVTEARNAAIARGANYYFKEYFDGVDAAYDEELAALDAGKDPEKFGDIADEYVVLYNVFENLGKAQTACDYALLFGYDEYDEKNLALGDALFEEFEVLAANEPRDSKALLAKSEEIAAAYELAVSNGKKIDKLVTTYLSAEESGAAELFGDMFEEMGELGYEALVYYNTEGTQEKLNEDVDYFQNVADAFLTASNAQNVRNEIYENGFEQFDYKNIARGDDAVEDIYVVLDAYYEEGVLDAKTFASATVVVYDFYKQSLDNGRAVEKLLDTRAAAIAVGADEFYPAEFALVDELCAEDLSFFNEGGSQTELESDLAKYKSIYESFAKSVALEDTYAYIVAKGYDKCDVRNFNAARDAIDELYEIADSTFDAAAMAAKLEEADALYKKVISNGNNVAFLEALRDDAISYGAGEYYPDDLESVDEYVEKSIAAFNAGGTQEDFDADLDNSEALYRSLKLGVDVADTYDFIIENGYDEFDSKNVAAGNATIEKIDDLLAEPNGEAIYETLNVALAQYNQVIDNVDTIYVLIDLRDEAVAAGAEEYFPDEIAIADDLVAEAIESFNADGTQEEFDADIDNFENIYTGFIYASNAVDLYYEVVENGYDELDTKNFAAGNKASEEALEIANTTFEGKAFLDKTSDAKYYYNKILENVDMCLEVLAARDEAVAAGADVYFPVEFEMVDEITYAALDNYNADGTQEELEADAENLKNIYVAFLVAVDAQDAYDVIIEEEYDLYDQKNFEAGNAASEEVAEVAFATLDGKVILATVHKMDDAYNQVIDNGHLIDGVLAIRQDAIDEGADEYFPEELAYADELAYDAVVYYNEEGTQAELEADAENFTYVYKAFGEAAAAVNVYIRIVENDFQSYDRNGFAAAERATDELEEVAYTTTDGKVLYAKASEVHAAYNKVVSNAFKKKSDSVRSEYLAVKKDADGIKASVADKQGYAAAESRMKNAEAIFARMSYEAAFSEYSAAKEAMSSVYASVLEKRNAAIEALERGRARSEELSILAAQADIIAPLSNN